MLEFLNCLEGSDSGAAMLLLSLLAIAIIIVGMYWVVKGLVYLLIRYIPESIKKGARKVSQVISEPTQWIVGGAFALAVGGGVLYFLYLAITQIVECAI